MIKSILALITKVLESKLKKSGIEELILQNQNYITVAKQVWNTVEENFRIAEKAEDKVKSKTEEFNTALLAKFPELTQTDIDDLRQSIAGAINAGKEAAISNSDLLQQLQTENTSLKSQLAAAQTALGITSNAATQS